MPFELFLVGEKYTRAGVADIIGLEAEKRKGGDWSTGYSFQRGAWFIFCNVGIAGRTGHDYSNQFEGDRLRWSGKTRSRLDQPQVRQLLSGDADVHVFFRSGDRDPFEFAGLGTAVEIEDGPPIRVLWSFENDPSPRPTDTPGEVRGEGYREGAVTTVTVNAYERNPAARRACIEHFGCSCQVCGFNFEETWGELGKDFVHVHHLKEISRIGEEYEVDPVNDLVPVCPNCHAMLHRRRPAIRVGDLKQFFNRQQEGQIIQ